MFCVFLLTQHSGKEVGKQRKNSCYSLQVASQQQFFWLNLFDPHSGSSNSTATLFSLILVFALQHLCAQAFVCAWTHSGSFSSIALLLVPSSSHLFLFIALQHLCVRARVRASGCICSVWSVMAFRAGRVTDTGFYQILVLNYICSECCDWLHSNFRKSLELLLH